MNLVLNKQGQNKRDRANRNSVNIVAVSAGCMSEHKIRIAYQTEIVCIEGKQIKQFYKVRGGSVLSVAQMTALFTLIFFSVPVVEVSIRAQTSILFFFVSLHRPACYSILD